MARNKYPEETVAKILDVSLKLFLEKGFDNTSIQDIVDNLGGLSKGAIYHHFLSKEAILLAVCNRFSSSISEQMNTILYDKTLNGSEKLQKMFMSSWSNTEQRAFCAAMPNLIDSPRLLAEQFRMTIDTVVPDYIYPVLKEGIYDGSIKTEYPLETAHVLMLLSNIWFNPLIYPFDKEDITKKLEISNKILKALGIDLPDDKLTEHIDELRSLQKK